MSDYLNDEPPKEKEEKSHSRLTSFFLLIYRDASRIYKAYPKAINTILLVLFAIIILFQFKPLLFLALFILYDMAFGFLSKKTDFKLRVEQVSVVGILFGYYLNVGYALIAVVVMMLITQYRNIKLTFFGATLDGIIWILFPFFAFAMRGLDIGTVALILPISRYLLKEGLGMMFGYDVHDLMRNSLNVLYQIVFLRYAGPFIGALMMG